MIDLNKIIINISHDKSRKKWKTELVQMIMLNEHMTIKDTERVVSNIIEYVCKAVKKIEVKGC